MYTYPFRVALDFSRFTRLVVPYLSIFVCQSIYLEQRSKEFTFMHHLSLITLCFIARVAFAGPPHEKDVKCMYQFEI